MAPLSVLSSSNGDMFRPVCVRFCLSFVSNGKSSHPFLKCNRCHEIAFFNNLLLSSAFPLDGNSLAEHVRVPVSRRANVIEVSVREGLNITRLVPKPLPSACPAIALLTLAAVE